MVSLWPWKGEDNSPASFEKALATLATKISGSQQRLDTLRQHSRRHVALWTLYTSFSYLLCFIILFLVVGWQNFTAWEYTALAGSPVLIYLIRSGIVSYYNFRIDAVTKRLEEQQAERTKTIERLKDATKYNSTRDLLEKYGEAPTSTKKKSKQEPSKKAAQAPKHPQRTGTNPPATANIPRNSPGAGQPAGPLLELPVSPRPGSDSHRITPQGAQLELAQAEFAPNAFPPAQHYAQGSDPSSGGKWYDRVLDILLGEDETLPKNRIVLVCQHCRLVNGQAPPGTNNLSDLGKWRCFGCGGWNGEEDEGLKAVQEMKEKIGLQALELTGSESENKIPEGIRHGVENEVDNLDEDSHSTQEVEEDERTEEVSGSEPKKGRPKGGRKKA